MINYKLQLQLYQISRWDHYTFNVAITSWNSITWWTTASDLLCTVSYTRLGTTVLKNLFLFKRNSKKCKYIHLMYVSVCACICVRVCICVAYVSRLVIWWQDCLITPQKKYLVSMCCDLIYILFEFLRSTEHRGGWRRKLWRRQTISVLGRARVTDRRPWLSMTETI
jgi:hypothetical protein